MNFSIVIPTLNEEKLLPPLLSQLNDPELKKIFEYEIIISDGGSSDATLKIAMRNADIVVTKGNDAKQNIAVGRNKGASAAKGEILIFFNGDIKIKDVKKLFDEVYNFSRKPDYSAMTCPVRVFPEEEKFSDKIFLGFYNKYFKFLNTIGLGMGRGECHVIRRLIFEELGGYNEDLPAGEDFELYTRLRKKGKVYFPENVCIYESPRRYRKAGHFKILFTWLINSIFVFFAKKSFSRKWEEVR
ncbi:MAG: glycosyltransferase [Chlorobi bacterium]|nr:glycosyltransferase [Chlorobiota bacterium]